MQSPINVLVVGECGDGKSTLIDSMRDPQKSVAPLRGLNPKGVTKDIVLYPCPYLDGVPLNLIDTPGVGDGTITPVALIALLEQFLKQDMVPGGIRGVVVTTPIADCRIKLGAQVVQIIVDKGFVAPAGGDKYANIILAGTKADKADDEEKVAFMHGGADCHESVRELFFRLAKPPGQGVAVMVSKHDYTPLWDAIKKLPAACIQYNAPKARVLASALAETLGCEAEALAADLDVLRDLVQQQCGEIRELMQKMDQQQQAHQRDMMEREEREESKRQRLEERIQQQAEQAAEAQRAHAEEMVRMQAEMQQSFAKALAERPPVVVRDGGGGCFPGSATVETPRGPKPMTALRAGDKVLVVAVSGELFFDEVYFFGHAAPGELGAYVWLRTSSGNALCASPRHFVPVAPLQEAGGPAGKAGWQGACYRYAGAVQVGDELWVRGAGDGHLVREAVVEVAGGTAQGVFNPYTFSGTLLVDGVVASVHSDWLLDDVVPISWLPSLHGIYQALLLPGRGLYRLLGAAAADLLEVNNPQGQRSLATGTSHRAFAFFLASHLLPAVAVTAAALQRFALG